MKLFIVFSIVFALMFVGIVNSHEHMKIIPRHQNDLDFLDFARFEEQEYAPPKVLNERLGNDVLLKCKDHDTATNVHHVQWKFAKCVDCDETDPSELKWKDLNQQNKKLYLKNITTTASGRYICIVRDHIMASYRLTVTNHSFKFPHAGSIKFVGRPPEIVDIEKSDDIAPHDNVAVKCKVFSPLVPRIWWMKPCDETKKCDLNYDGEYYQKINVTYQDILLNSEENIYVSKLRLDNFTLADSGMYVCVTMTELGKDYRNFTLHLSPGESYTTHEGHTTASTTSSLNFLFLVPFVFISVSICIDCVGKRIGVRKSKQDVVLLEVLQPSTSNGNVYHC